MTAQPHSESPSGGTRTAPPDPRGPWATGGTTFAGVLLLLNGILAVLEGISAIAADDVYPRIDTYVYKINLTGWGWILLVLGVIAVLTGCGILAGAAWARAVGIVLASLSLLAQFLFLPYAPVWSVITMGIDVFVIWALAAYEPDTARR
ncbi:hypothetical protein ACF1GT_18470 [Streptomyces sp. NPDC014636]|uniref:DUF7144 family membrane protein n=1 Tax=Streptomyces sp. NPDC014636 TaxID=3364876 RepID=UPI0036F4B97A